MAKLDLRNHRPSVEMLPDGRQRATFTYDVREWVGRTLADIAAECWADWGAAAPGDFSALRLVKQELKGLEPDKTGALPLVRIYEELHATDETQVGEDSIAYGEDGGKTIVAQFIQFASSPATPGTINTTTAPNDATLYLNSEDSESDGTLRRIKRTYVQAGQVSTSEEVKNNGALTLRTITSVRSIPATPSGFTLVSSSVKNPDGVPTYSYTFAKGSGTISVSDDVKYNGSLHTRTIRSIGASPSTPSGYTLVSYDSTEQDGYTLYSYNFAKGDGTVSISEDTKNNGNLSTITIRALGTAPETPSGYTLVSLDESKQDGYTVYTSSFAKGDGVISTQNDEKYNGALLTRTIRSLGTTPDTPAGYILVSSDSTEQDGYTLYTSNFAKGIGQISKTTDYSQSSDQGVHGITRVTVRYLVAPDGTIQPTSLAGFIRIGEDYTEQDGYRIWTTTWAKGTGTVSTQDETKNNGALLMRTIRAIGAAPSTPSGYVLVSADSSEQDGITVYTSSFAQGSGEISRSVDYSQSNDQGATGITRTTIRHITPALITSDPTTLAGSVKVGEDKSESDGHRIWTITYAKGTGLVSDDTDYSNQGALTRYHRVSLGTIPTSPSGVAGALSRITVTNGGSGYTSAPTVGITGGGGTGATATAVLSDRQVVALVLGSGGSGYTSAPTISFSGGGGSGASATAVLATRTVASIALGAGGSGYTSAPTVSVNGNGAGATATAVMTGTSIASIALDSAGTGYTSTPTVAITGGGGTGATATVNVAGGSILSLTLTSPGTGYTSAPTISFTGGGGTGAAASCALTATDVASAAVSSPGSGFTSAPSVAVSGGGGTGATVTAALTGTTLASIAITAGGSGYTTAPTVTITGGGGTGATATATLNGRSVASVTVSNAGSGYTTVPTVSFSGGGGSGAAATVSLTGVTLASATLSAAGSGYTSAPTVSLSGGGGSGGAVTPVLTPTAVASVTMTAAGSGFGAAPTVSFTGGGGSGAAATVALVSGISGLNITSGGSGYSPDGTYAGALYFSGGGGSGINIAVVISGGSVVGFILDPAAYAPASRGYGYTSAPTVDFSTLNAQRGGSGAAATAVLAGGLSYIRITSSGSGYTSAPTITISGGGGSGAAATALVTGGIVYEIRVTNTGSGYTSAPTISFSGGGGTGAAGAATIGTGSFNSVTLTATGSGYTSSPTVSFSGGGGTGATVTAALAPTTVASLTVSAPGSGYTSAPTLTISGGGGTGATGSVSITPTTIASIAVTNGGTGYTTAPTISFSGGGGGSGAAASAGMSAASVASVTITNAGSGFTSAPSVSFSGGSGVGAAASAAITPTTIASLTVSAAGSGYTSAPTLTISGGGGSGATGVASLTGTTLASVSMTASGSGYVSSPTVSFSGGGGSGAAATVASTGVAITGFTITAGGSGYTSVPDAVLSGGGGSGAVGTPVLTPTSVASVTVTAAGSGFTVAPTVSFSGGGGSGAVATATLSTASIASLVITSGGTGYTGSPSVAFAGGDGSGASATATVSTASVLAVTLTAPGTGYTSAPTIAFSGGAGSGATAFSPAGLAAVLISANIRKEAGFDVYDYTWAAGAGVVSKRYQQRPGGLRLETWVSIGQAYDSSYMVPPGEIMAKDYDDNAGHTVFTVTCMQSANGGAPTDAAEATEAWVPFGYPGRAKAYTATVGAATVIDVFLSPPTRSLVLATRTISYQTSPTLGTLAPALWNPTEYATMRVAFLAVGNYNNARSIVKGLEGYTAVGDATTSFTAGDPTRLSVMGELVSYSTSGTLTLTGGPTPPDGSTAYTLHAEIEDEPAFVTYAGVKYYRKVQITATPAAQAALPV